MCTCVFVLPCVIATIPRSFVPILDACGNSFPSAPGVRPRSSPSTHCLRTSPSDLLPSIPASIPAARYFSYFDFVHFFETRDAFEERKDESGVDVS